MTLKNEKKKKTKEKMFTLLYYIIGITDCIEMFACFPLDKKKKKKKGKKKKKDY